eukprot:Skav219474  [mRNA]  locus=scaffold2719:28827:31674:+ [translate_table: standard]
MKPGGSRGAGRRNTVQHLDPGAVAAAGVGPMEDVAPGTAVPHTELLPFVRLHACHPEWRTEALRRGGCHQDIQPTDIQMTTFSYAVRSFFSLCNCVMDQYTGDIWWLCLDDNAARSKTAPLPLLEAQVMDAMALPGRPESNKKYRLAVRGHYFLVLDDTGSRVPLTDADLLGLEIISKPGSEGIPPLIALKVAQPPAAG